MALATTNVELEFTNIVANVPIVVAIPTYSTADIYLKYGASDIFAVPNVDYAVTQNDPVNPTFTSVIVTPKASLLTKIGAGLNRVKIGRHSLLTTDFDLDDAFNRQEVVREFDRLWMVTQELGNVDLSNADAGESAEAAAESAGEAAVSEGNASLYASQAATSAANASTSASAAAASAVAASGSATTANTNATNAAASATAASASAAAAANSAATASGAASTASTAATTATTQAGIATTQATNAATSATNAANSASAASTSATNAAASAAAAASKIAGPGTVTSGNPVVFSGTTGLVVAQVTFGAFKTSLALDNVNNTSDLNKPISIAEQAALDLKANLAGPSFTGTMQVLGGQIGFPATQVNSGNANVLDDYEEGTFTLALDNAGTSPTGVTTSANSGTYTKVGRLVYFEGRFTLTSKGAGGVGQCRLVQTGLPTGVNLAPVQIVRYSNVTLPSSGIGMFGFLTAGGAYFEVYTQANTTCPSVTWADITNTFDCFISGCYRTAT